MATYIALMRKDPTSDYSVNFPDFPGCVTAGTTLQEAVEFAREALQLCIETMAQKDRPIPDPTSIEEVMSDPENSDAVAFLVTAPGIKAKRINITVPESDLPRIDGYASECRMSRSAFLVWAAKRVIENHLRP